MLNVTDLLKEGTKHITGLDDVIVQSISAVKDLVKIVRTSYGPQGTYTPFFENVEIVFVRNELIN